MKNHLLPAVAMGALLLAAAPITAQVAITGAPTASPSAPSRPSDATSSRPSSGSPDTMLADAAEAQKYAVGVVVIVVPGHGAVPIGTAWAFDTNLFATNGHVVDAMEELAKKVPDAPFYIAINQRPDKRLRVSGYRKHPRYGKMEARFDGKTPIHSPDIAIIRTREAAPAHFRLASEAQLQALRAGTRVAFLGFPMESLVANNIDTQMPVATMQSGIVTSLSDYFLGDSGFGENHLVRHNLPSAGGASGSPIFTPDGTVVAILWGGNIELHLEANSDGKVAQVRAPNAAQVNFAERIDSLAAVPRP